MPDIINDALVAIKNAESVGKGEVVVRPTSKLLAGVLDIMKKNKYLGEVEFVEDKKGGQVKIKLPHKLNDCGPIKPRFAVKKTEFEKWEQRYLPSRDFGILVVSTPMGLMTHEEAKKKETGGRLVAYIY